MFEKEAALQWQSATINLFGDINALKMLIFMFTKLRMYIYIHTHTVIFLFEIQGNETLLLFKSKGKYLNLKCLNVLNHKVN